MAHLAEEVDVMYRQDCWIFRAAVALTAVMLCLAPIGEAAADGLLGLYAGATVGPSTVQTNSSELLAGSVDRFDQRDVGYQFLAGIQPISSLGAELSYIDLGHPSGPLGAAPANVAMKGVAGFGVLYLPVQVVGLYLKAGAANIQNTVNANFGAACAADLESSSGLKCHASGSSTQFAAGAGLQVRFGQLGLRGEYERFTVSGGNPGLLSFGATWTF